MTLRFHGRMRFFALKRSMVVPRRQVSGVTLYREAAQPWPDATLRMGGAFVPGKVAAGRFWKVGKGRRIKSFWAMYDPERALGIDLRDHTYAYLVVQVDDPEGELARVREWIDG